MYLIEKFRSDALLHQVRTDDADVLVACDRFRLRYSAFEAVPDKRKRRSFINPLLRNRMSKNKDRYAQRMSTAPSFGEVECPPSCHQGPCRCARLQKVVGGLRGDPERHLRTGQPVFGVAAHVPGQKPLAALTHRCFRTVVGPSDEPIKRRCVPCADFPHGFVLQLCSSGLVTPSSPRFRRPTPQARRRPYRPAVPRLGPTISAANPGKSPS